MIGIVVVTHGQLANEIVNAAEMIVGEIPNVTAVSIGWHDSTDDAEKTMENKTPDLVVLDVMFPFRISASVPNTWRALLALRVRIRTCFPLFSRLRTMCLP